VGPLCKEVLEHYGDEASAVFKHFPLNFHKDARLAAEASLAANAQGRFWEYHDLLFANRKKLKRADLEAYAEQVGLDVAKFKAALDSGEFSKAVDGDLALGRRAGVGGTPTIFINGRKYQGPRNAKGMIGVIDRQILNKK